MSREIKFRGYVEKIDDIGIDVPHEGHFVYGDLVHGNNFDYIVGGLIEATEEYAALEWWQTIQQGAAEQFTGLKDKNGKDIYEGDLLKFKILFSDDDYEVGQVTWSNQDAGFVLECFNLWKFASRAEIVGNIHENTELLEADK